MTRRLLAIKAAEPAGRSIYFAEQQPRRAQTMGNIMDLTNHRSATRPSAPDRDRERIFRIIWTINNSRRRDINIDLLPEGSSLTDRRSVIISRHRGSNECHSWTDGPTVTSANYINLPQ